MADEPVTPAPFTADPWDDDAPPASEASYGQVIPHPRAGRFEPPPSDDDAQPAETATGGEGIIPLGHDAGVFYYLSRSARQVYALTPQQHGKMGLMSLASLPHYWERTSFYSEKTGNIAWDKAADHLMRACRDVGIFDPDRVRGRGAWIDNGRAVLHLGDRLIVDGAASGLMLDGSAHVYQAAKPMLREIADALPVSEAQKLMGICKRLRWQHGISGTLFAGFIAVAPICGGLAWRPSVWVTGGSGSGKSWIYDNILRPAMGGTALQVQSKTSEAGIRQALGSDARPVLFDEAEREDAAAAARMQGVLDLLRQSSSEGGAEIVKGSQNQSGAKRYRVRSCFLFSSINVGIEHQADENRITILPLRAQTKEDTEKKFEELCRDVLDTLTPDYAAGLLARSVRMLPTIRANAETFARAVAVVLGSRRAGDQLGALLSGAFSLISDKLVSPDAAEKWVRSQDWAESGGSDTEADERRLVSFLMQARVRINLGNGSGLDVPVGRLVVAARNQDEKIPWDAAEEELSQIGIKRAWIEGVEGLLVSTSHSTLKRLLQGTPWASGWHRTLARLPGAHIEKKSKRFAFGHFSKPVWVPIQAIDPSVTEHPLTPQEGIS